MRNKSDQVVPSARNSRLVVQRLESEVLVYDTEQHKAHCLNQNAALIWEHCDGQRTVKDLSDLLQSKAMGAEIGTKESQDLVWVALDQLEKSQLLNAPIIRQETTGGLSRRQLMKAAGIAALIAVPVVSSIIAPKAAEASTCLATGTACTISAQCCSGLCVGTCT